MAKEKRSLCFSNRPAIRGGGEERGRGGRGGGEGEGEGRERGRGGRGGGDVLEAQWQKTHSYSATKQPWAPKLKMCGFHCTDCNKQG